MAKELKNLLIVGGGLMGKGVAHVLSALGGVNIAVYDIAYNDFLEGLKGTFSQLVAHGVYTAEEAQRRVRRVTFYNDVEEAAKDADLVVECVFEDMALKRETFAKLEGVCRADTILCTNTSVMSPTEIGKNLKHKERFAGTHFWNPAYLIPLVEVVKAEQTSDETAQTVLELLLAAGKKAVLCKKDVPGFIANRMQHALWREALSIVELGIADAATVDEAVKNSFGLRLPQLGPLENADMVGLDLAYSIHDYILPHLCDSHAPSPLLKELKAENKLGFKTGEGLQSWDAARIQASRNDLSEYLIKMLYNK